MGSTGTAIANDGTAVFYNPACLTENGFSLTMGNPDTEQKVISGNQTFLKLGYLGYGNWQQNMITDEVRAQAISISNRSSWLSYGLTYKMLNWNINSLAGNGWSTDFGFLVRVTPQFKIGLQAFDLFSSKDHLAGTAGRIGFGFAPYDGLILAAGDLEINRQGGNIGHLGLEISLVKGLTIRGGLDGNQSTAGASLDFGVFAIDYAARFQTNQTIHCFDAGIKYLPQNKRPFSVIKPKEFALIDVAGALKGGRDEISLIGGYNPGLDSILSQIRAAAKDNSIDGIMLRIGGFDGGLGGMAMVQELRREIGRAKEKGKKVIAYIEGSAVGDEYYLASVADKIIAPPGAAIGGFGKSIAIIRLKGLYNKFGIEWQVLKQGEYKNAFDPYSEKLTKAQEEEVKGLVADLYRQMLTDISTDRKIKLEKIKEIGDGMIFPARQAKEMGLIDQLGYYVDARKAAAEIAGQKGDEAKIVKPEEIQPADNFWAEVFGVAVIEIDGEIVSGAGGDNFLFGGRATGSETVCRYIKKASDDLFVKAIVLRIDSPGGDAIAAGEIYQALDYARSKNKTVIASIGSLGASGGYYIACGANKIVANESSLTGSIGVIGYLPVYSELMKKFDVTAEVIKEGAHADMFSGLRKLSTVEMDAMMRLQAEDYNEFIQAVVKGRQLTTAEVKEAAEGRLYTGTQALDLKLIDQIGSFSDAVDLAKKEAKIVGEPRLIFYHERNPFFNFGEGMADTLGLRNSFWPGRTSLN
jgi:protease-4